MRGRRGERSFCLRENDPCSRWLLISRLTAELALPAPYACDSCGACCRGHLLVECDDLDVLREPRLIDADRHHRGKSVPQIVYEIQTAGKALLLAVGTPCVFLAENRCSIYSTRPNCCVGFSAGDEQCQACRAAEGLPPLLPMSAPN